MAAVTCARCGAPIHDNEVFCTQCGAARPESAFDLPYAGRGKARRRGLLAAAAAVVIAAAVVVVVLVTRDHGHQTVQAQAPASSSATGLSHSGLCATVDLHTVSDAFGNVIATAKGPVSPPPKFLGVDAPVDAKVTSCATLFLIPQSFGDLGPEVAGLRVTVEQYPTEAAATARMAAIADHARSTKVGDTEKVRVNPDTGDISRDVRDESASFGAGAVAFERNDSFEHLVFRVGDQVVGLTCDTSLTDLAKAGEFDSALLGRMEPAGRAVQKAV